MNAALLFTEQGKADLKALETDKSKAAILKQVKKALGYLQINPRHPSLNTHVFTSLENPFDPEEKVFEAYAQNNTPGAYRIFWSYGPKKDQITIIAITPHP